MKSKTFEKASGAELDYKIDWTLWLSGDSISTSTWELDSGITSSGDTNTSKTATIDIAGGDNGDNYSAVNTIVTIGGNTQQAKLCFHIRDGEC